MSIIFQSHIGQLSTLSGSYVISVTIEAYFLQILAANDAACVCCRPAASFSFKIRQKYAFMVTKITKPWQKLRPRWQMKYNGQSYKSYKNSNI